MSLENCVHRELMEETGYRCEIIKKLSTQYLNKKPQTGEKINIELHHFRAELLGEVRNYEKFSHNDHDVFWLKIDEIKLGKYDVAPNIEFLLDKNELQ